MVEIATWKDNNVDRCSTANVTQRRTKFSIIENYNTNFGSIAKKAWYMSRTISICILNKIEIGFSKWWWHWMCSKNGIFVLKSSERKLFRSYIFQFSSNAIVTNSRGIYCILLDVYHFPFSQKPVVGVIFNIMHAIWGSTRAEISRKYSPKMTQMVPMLHSHKVIMIFDGFSVLDISIHYHLSLDMVQGHKNLCKKSICGCPISF
jgi:hypothetical protein